MHSSSFVTFCPTCFCFTDTSTTEIYTLSLHDALPIFVALQTDEVGVEDARHDLRDLRLADTGVALDQQRLAQARRDRKSTRLNSSHLGISYAVFCLKKKKK